MRNLASLTLLALAGCSPAPVDTSSQSVPLAEQDSQGCFGKGPKQMTFTASPCAVGGPAQFEELFYGNGGSNTVYTSGTANTPNTIFTNITENTQPACATMMFAIIGQGPVTYASDHTWKWESITEAQFVQAFTEHFHQAPSYPYDYWDNFSTLQFLVDMWNCHYTSLPGSAIGGCPTNITPVTFTDQGTSKQFQASQNACDLSFTFATVE
jgi:hypothetical protein